MQGRSRQAAACLARKGWLVSCGLASFAIGLWGALSGCGPMESGNTGAADSVRWTAVDESGRRWELLAWKLPGATGPQATQPDRSKPLVGTVNVQQVSRELVVFSLEVATPAGEGVYSLTVAGKRPPEPTFTITDAAGTQVAAGKFEYG